MHTHTYECMWKVRKKVGGNSWEGNEVVLTMYFCTEGKCRKDRCLYVCSVYFAMNIFKGINYYKKCLDPPYLLCRAEIQS